MKHWKRTLFVLVIGIVTGIALATLWSGIIAGIGTVFTGWTAQQQSALADTVTAIFAIAIGLQTVILVRQLRADHERSRRTKATDLLLDWSRNLDKEVSIARRIVESLPEEAVRSIYDEQDVWIPKRHRKMLRKVLRAKIPAKKRQDMIKLNRLQTSELRWLLIKYLNTLEAILSAWRHNIADREMLEEEFGYLFAENLGHAALRKFRTAAGGSKAYPSIEVFAGAMKEKQAQELREKARLP